MLTSIDWTLDSSLHICDSRKSPGPGGLVGWRAPEDSDQKVVGSSLKVSVVEVPALWLSIWLSLYHPSDYYGQESTIKYEQITKKKM